MRRILLAEDDAAMRGHLARMLEQAGFAVVPVADGEAAIACLERARIEHDPFDLLLSDIVMPGIGGIELARHCEEVSAQTKIMLITGFAAVTLRLSHDTPHARLLSKPFHLRRLVAEVHALFEQPAQLSL